MAEGYRTIKRNGQAYFEGSNHIAFNGYDFYLHEAHSIMSVYKGLKLTKNVKYESSIHMHKAFEEYKLQILGNQDKKAQAQVHALKLGVILIHNTNINSPHKNEIKYFQVTMVLDDMKVELREIEAETVTHGNYSSCIPMPSLFKTKSEPFIKSVVANSVDIENGIATRLEFVLNTVLTDANGKPLIQVKKYKISEYGLKCI